MAYGNPHRRSPAASASTPAGSTIGQMASQRPLPVGGTQPERMPRHRRRRRRQPRQRISMQPTRSPENVFPRRYYKGTSMRQTIGGMATRR